MVTWWAHKRARILVVAWLLVGACGGRTDLGEAGGAGGPPGNGGGGSEGNGGRGGRSDGGPSGPGDDPSDGGSTGGPGGGPSLGGQSLVEQLEGYWQQKIPGDCDYEEDWLELRPPDKLVHTRLFQSACDPQPAVFRIDDGTYQEASGQRLRLEWRTPDGTIERRIDTTSIVTVPLTDEQGGSGLAINTASYVRLEGARTFRRLRRHQIIDAEGSVRRDEQSITDLIFDDHLDPTDDQLPCRMKVEMFASLLDVAQGILEPITGRDGLDVGCHYGPAEQSGWLELSGDGYLRGAADTTHDFAGGAGFYERHPTALVRVFIHAFSPVLYLEQTNLDVLFEARNEGLHFRSATPPTRPR